MNREQRRAYIAERLTRDFDGLKDEMLRVGGIREVDLKFGPGVVIPVNGNPAELLMPTTHGHLSGLTDGPCDSVASLRADYVNGRIEIDEFERRVGELLADE